MRYIISGQFVAPVNHHFQQEEEYPDLYEQQQEENNNNNNNNNNNFNNNNRNFKEISKNFTPEKNFNFKNNFNNDFSTPTRNSSNFVQTKLNFSSPSPSSISKNASNFVSVTKKFYQSPQKNISSFYNSPKKNFSNPKNTPIKPKEIVSSIIHFPSYFNSVLIENFEIDQQKNEFSLFFSFSEKKISEKCSSCGRFSSLCNNKDENDNNINSFIANNSPLEKFFVSLPCFNQNQIYFLKFASENFFFQSEISNLKKSNFLIDFYKKFLITGKIENLSQNESLCNLRSFQFSKKNLSLSSLNHSIFFLLRSSIVIENDLMFNSNCDDLYLSLSSNFVEKIKEKKCDFVVSVESNPNLEFIFFFQHEWNFLEETFCLVEKPLFIISIEFFL